MITSLILIAKMVYENYWRARKYLAAPFDQQANWRRQAKLLKLSKEAGQRLEWLIYYEKKKNASLTCRRFGIARKTFYNLAEAL